MRLEQIVISKGIELVLVPMMTNCPTQSVGACSQVIARQPVILLATAHVLQEDMHPDLLSFFSPRNVVLLDQDLPIAEPKSTHLRPTSSSSGEAACSAPRPHCSNDALLAECHAIWQNIGD